MNRFDDLFPESLKLFELSTFVTLVLPVVVIEYLITGELQGFDFLIQTSKVKFELTAKITRHCFLVTNRIEGFIEDRLTLVLSLY